MWCLYIDHCLDIVIVILSSINFPIVICLPAVCYFSREKPLVKSTAPGSILYHICFSIFYLPLLFSDLLFQKPKNTLLQFFYFAFLRDLFIQSSTNQYIFYPRGIDNPSYASRCKYLFFVCRYHLHSVAWLSYWIDNLAFITEGNTYCSYTASSLPLWGNTDALSSRINNIR